ncbi:hypothetical protein BEL04_01795 [Mucilaginibacter sp. PPCGB 2223]|nr:hypothetical protein BEL04_01795 [Mucilaginibacter sp. PPCGB 2223]
MPAAGLFLPVRQAGTHTAAGISHKAGIPACRQAGVAIPNAFLVRSLEPEALSHFFPTQDPLKPGGKL